MDKAEQILDKNINEDDLNFIFHEKKQLWQELLNAVNEALRQPPVSGSLPPDELEKSLGSTNRQFTIWHDGGEWLISLKGKEQEQCKKLREWICGNDR